MAVYSERPEVYSGNMDRLHRKFQTAKTLVPAPIVDIKAGATVGIIAYGSSDCAMIETRDQLREEANLETSYLRLRAYPFPAEVEAFIRRHDRVYVVDQNRDGQMCKLLEIESDPALATRLRSVRHYNGLPIDARTITDAVLAQERAK